MSAPQGMPAPQVPIVGPGGTITLPWLSLLRALWIRTGSASGSSSGGAPQFPAPGVSPFSFTASAPGLMAIGGNGVQRVRLLRGGYAIPIAAHYGAVPLRAGDELSVDFRGYPHFTWLPD